MTPKPTDNCKWIMGLLWLGRKYTAEGFEKLNIRFVNMNLLFPE